MAVKQRGTSMKPSKQVVSVDDLKPSEINIATRYMYRKLLTNGDLKVKEILNSEIENLFTKILLELIDTQIYNFTKTQQSQKIVPETEELQTTDWVKQNKQVLKSMSASPKPGEIMKAINQSVNSLSSKTKVKKTMLENMYKAITKSLQYSTQNDSKVPDGSEALKTCLQTAVEGLSKKVNLNKQTIYDGVCVPEERKDILMLVFVSQFCSWQKEGHLNRRVDTKQVCVEFKNKILSSCQENWSSLNRIMTHDIGNIIMLLRSISSDRAIHENVFLRERQNYQKFVRQNGQIQFLQNEILKNTTHITDKNVLAKIAQLCDKVGMLFFCLSSHNNRMLDSHIPFKTIVDVHALIDQNFFQGENKAMDAILFNESHNSQSAQDYYFFTPGSHIPNLGGKLAINIWIIHRIWNEYIIPLTAAGNMIKTLIDSICTEKEFAHNPGTLARDNPSQSYEGNPGELVQDMLTGNIYKLVLN